MSKKTEHQEYILETYHSLKDRFPIKDKKDQEKILALGYELLEGMPFTDGTFKLINEDMEKWKENGYNHFRIIIGYPDSISLVGKRI